MHMTPTEPKYTLEGSRASEIMVQRDVNRFAAFFIPQLSPGMRLLDCGCGPGSITLGLAQILYPGEVVGIDINQTEIQTAKAAAVQRGITNVTFQVGNANSLDFPDGSFDGVF